MATKTYLPSGVAENAVRTTGKRYFGDYLLALPFHDIQCFLTLAAKVQPLCVWRKGHAAWDLDALNFLDYFVGGRIDDVNSVTCRIGNVGADRAGSQGNG